MSFDRPLSTRREIFALAACGALLRHARAQSYRNYSRCLPDHLSDLADRACQLRTREIAKLTTPGAIRARQQWVTETFWKLAGGQPERTPLNARAAGSFDREGYRVEKLIYESQPGFHVSANLYIPSGDPPFPGVLFQMGHTANGKGGDLYQRCCQGLARLGYLVLAFDPMGQGERLYYPSARLGATGEHSYAGRQMLLKGNTMTRMQTWDAVRSLDYLAAHPMVDPKRLASTGQSGGATVTMLLAAVDDRLAAAAVSSGNTENFACANFNPPGSTDDAEQDLIGSGPLGFDRWDLLYPMAPKPLQIQVSNRDFFGTYSPRYLENGQEEFQKLGKVYAALGHADRLAWFGTPLPHGLTHDMRVAIYNWFGRWLKGDVKPVTEEPPTSPERDEVLAVCDTGNVMTSLHGETPFTLNRKYAAARTPAKLEQVIGAARPSPGGMTSLARATYRESEIQAVEFASAPKVWVPAWLFKPRKADAARPVVVVLEPNGRGAWHEGDLYDSLASRGCTVCAPDLRNTGDLTPEFSRGAAGYARGHDNDEEYAWATFMLGEPLLGQRVTDLLAIVQALRGPRIVVAARGASTVVAQFAAAIEPAIGTLYLAGGLASYQRIVDSETYTYPLGSMVPAVLRHTDLPELARSIAPRRVIVAGAVDAMGRKLPAADVRAEYPGDNIEIRADAAWNAEALAAI